MKFSIRLLLVGVVQYILMSLFILYLPGDTFISYNVLTLEIQGNYPKWNELVFVTIPLLLLVGYFFESYLNIKKEKITGSPYKLKKVIIAICLVLFVIFSLSCWSGLIIQKRFMLEEQVSQPKFFVISFIFSIGLIILGKYLLKVVRGDCVGFNIPFLTRDHSIWRRVNSLIGKMLIISGPLFIIDIVLYELFLKGYIVLVGGIIILFLVVIIPFIYCLYLNSKAKKVK